MNLNERAPGPAVASPDHTTTILQRIIATMGENEQTAEPAVDTAQMKRLPYKGRISTEVLERAHPYRLAEVVDAAAIKEFYALQDTSFADTWSAWRDIELGPRGPGRKWSLGRAAEHLGAICASLDPGIGYNTETPEADQELWYDAAVARAAIPSIFDRVLHGGVTTATADLVYRSLVNNVLNRPLKPGDRAEAIVFALGARNAAQGDPTQFLYLGSPREGTNQYRNGSDKVFNHDLFQVAPGRTKVPVEVKLHRWGKKRLSNYDPAIVRIDAFNVLALPIMGETVDFTVDRTEIRRQAPDFLEQATYLLVKEVDFGVPLPELDAAGEALARHIQQQRELVLPVDPRYSKPG